MTPFFRTKKINPEDIIIKYDKDVNPKAILGLYMSVGWQQRDLSEIKKSMENSIALVSAWDNDVLVGFARATGDGIFNATVWDVAVRPLYQKQGIGKLVVNSMLAKLDDYNIPLITLYTAYTKKDFYSKLGFETDFNKVVGMYRYKLRN